MRSIDVVMISLIVMVGLVFIVGMICDTINAKNKRKERYDPND